jgi:hypothetical protein
VPKQAQDLSRQRSSRQVARGQQQHLPAGLLQHAHVLLQHRPGGRQLQGRGLALLLPLLSPRWPLLVLLVRLQQQ